MMRRIASLLFVCALGMGCPGAPPGPASPSWSEAFPAKDVGWLLSAFGPNASDLYAVGGRPEAAAIMHYDGSAWTSSAPPVGTPLLNWVFGFGASDLWMVGNRGTILRFDGSAYTTTPTATAQNLWGVWGSSPSDLWIVGGNGNKAGDAVILRGDRRGFHVVELPALEHPDVFAFYKVWGSGADDVYVVGQRGVVLHWDGAALTELFLGASQDLIAVWGSDADHVSIVGGRQNAELLTGSGSVWHKHDLGGLPGLNGVTMRRPDQTHVVGQNGLIGRLDWATGEFVRAEAPTALSLHAIFGDSGGHLLTVGGSIGSWEGPFEGVAFRRSFTDEE